MLNITNLRPIFSESSKYALQFGDVRIAWYAVCILSGVILAAVVGYFCFFKKLKLDSDLLFEGLALGLIFGITGARIYYVLFYEGHYDNFLDMINITNGGLAIHGAVIAIFAYLPIWCKIRKIKLIYVLEITLPLVLLAQVVGRWGNFMNQEAFGGLIKYPGMIDEYQPLTDANLLAQREFLSNMFIPKFIIDRMYIPYSSASGFTVAGYYQPTFLYESILNLIGVTTYMISRKYIKKLYVGDAVCFYLIWYGAVRYFIESMRTDPLYFFNTGLKVAQLISILFIVGGLALFIIRRVAKFHLISCYDALYKEGSTIMIEPTNEQPKEQDQQEEQQQGEK